MKKGNVLVIGNSGVGKSTLINAVLGENIAGCGGDGTSGTTKRLKIYENSEVPFRLIDTVGFEPSIKKKHQAINAVKKWSKDSAKSGHEDNQINVIWFCIEGTSKKLFPDMIKSLSNSISMWKTIPVIVVITKSYSIPEREDNIEMVYNAFARQKHCTSNLKKVIPVVASAYQIDEKGAIIVPPEGITELIDATNALMPEGIRAAKKDIGKYKLDRKSFFAHGIVCTSTLAGVSAGALPIPVADSVVLSGIEIAEINTLAQIYGINKGGEAKQFLNSIVEAGAISAVAKTAISALKAIPGVNLATSVINALIAGCFVAAIGEGSKYVFEQIYLGKKSITDIEWAKTIIQSNLSSDFITKMTNAAQKITTDANPNAIAEIICELFGIKQRKSTRNIGTK